MQLTLPRRRDGKKPPMLDVEPHQSILIVGANGAGKTRFTRATAQAIGKLAYPMSALDALYHRYGQNNQLPDALRRRLSPAVVATAERSDTPPTILDLLMAQLMNDEMINLIGYKLAIADHRNATLRRTRLDNVIELWQDIFPGNRVLIDSGKMLFARGVDVNTYSALRLSDGEKAVLYYAAAVLYAPDHAVIFVEAPEMFLHPSLTASLWNRLEAARADCTFVYTTHDTEFASSRNGAPVVWVRDCDPVAEAWDYDILPPHSGLTQELYLTLIGARKPVLFIEGDSERSIDAKLYPLIFPDYNVRSLGSCNKVIEATRTFNDLSTLHKVESFGIVDRDRRDEGEVAYLRRKQIMVPDVAEIENMLLLEDIIAAMAESRGHSADRAVNKVKKAVINMFRGDLHQQALLHTRHRVKRTMEYRVDSRSADVATFEKHLRDLLDEINVRRIYEDFCKDFHQYVDTADYRSVLRVYNQKSMLPGCNVAQLCGFKGKEDYIEGILETLRPESKYAAAIRNAVRSCLTGEY